MRKAGDTPFLIEPTEFQNASNVAGANIQNVKHSLNMQINSWQGQKNL